MHAAGFEPARWYHPQPALKAGPFDLSGTHAETRSFGDVYTRAGLNRLSPLIRRRSRPTDRCLYVFQHV